MIINQNILAFVRAFSTSKAATYEFFMRRRYLPISLIKIKGIQMGDHEIKTVNFFDSPTIFPRDITCLKRIQVILKLNEDASIFKINFSKAKFYGLEHMKIELINQDK